MTVSERRRDAEVAGSQNRWVHRQLERRAGLGDLDHRQLGVTIAASGDAAIASSRLRHPLNPTRTWRICRSTVARPVPRQQRRDADGGGDRRVVAVT